jgi:alkaline phosphatase
MSKYADVYLLPIREENVAAYKKIATSAGKVFMKHGALRYREYVLSDAAAMGVIPFPKNLKLKPGETVIYAAVEFKSEAQRNKAMKAIFADPAMHLPEGTEMPFDYKRMVYGGFKILVDL